MTVGEEVCLGKNISDSRNMQIENCKCF